MTINTDIVLKLFDTLKETDKDLTAKIEKQTEALVSIGHNINNIKDGVTQHLLDSKGLAECSETTETTVKTILEKVKKMHKSVWIMIAVVGISFSLMTIAYFVVRSSIEDIVHTKVKEMQNIPDSNIELIKQIEELKKQIEKLRPPQNQQPKTP